MKKGIEGTIRSLLISAGVTANGHRDADIQVIHPDFYKRVIREGPLGFGEAYMDGWWEVKKLDELCFRLLSASLDQKIKNMNYFVHYMEAILLNTGKKSKAFEVGVKHYDLGNLLFQKMLDKRMVYSCGYW